MRNSYLFLYIIHTLSVLSSNSSTSDQESELQCKKLNSVSTNLQQNLKTLWNVLILHQIDQIFFLALCPIILILQIFFIITYIRNNQLLAKPGNIFFGILCIEAFLNIHLYSNTIYRTIFNNDSSMPNSFVPFCLTMAIFGSFFTVLHFMYLIMFMFYTIFVFRFSLKKKSQTFWIILNLFVLVASSVITIYFYLQKFMGLNFYGICGLTVTRKVDWNLSLPIIEIILCVIFLILGIFTYCYFQRHMPEGQNFRKRKLQQSKIIFMYVVGFSSFLILMSVMNLLLKLNCSRQKPIPNVQLIILVINIMRLVQFIFLLFLISYNQRYRKKLKNTFKGIFQNRIKNNKRSLLKSSSDHTQIIQMEDVFFNEKLLEMKDRSNEIDLLLLSQVYTIISGVYVTYYEYFRKQSMRQDIKRINYRQSMLFSIDNRSIISYQTEARSLIKLKILSCDIVIHSPQVFKKLLAMQGLNDVFQSFRIVDNSQKMSNLAQGQGGKSGQFFFFSCDNKYVLKTITCQQFQFYQQNLQVFYDYYLQNPKSLLAKILGLFTFRGDEMQRTYYIILMKNILGCKKSQIIRLYDLKGSKYDRQVLFQQTQINQISKLTLKDIDFINYESILQINNETLKTLKNVLQKDSNFLKCLNLLDYSLLVVRVRWEVQPQNASFWGQLQRIPHQSSQKQYYHIGVIDYMQKWDLQKKGQRWWKNFIGKKDVSAQQPNHYQNRFMQFIDQITSYQKRTVKRNQDIIIQLKEVRAVTQPNTNKDSNNQQSNSKKQRSTNKI